MERFHLTPWEALPSTATPPPEPEDDEAVDDAEATALENELPKDEVNCTALGVWPPSAAVS